MRPTSTDGVYNVFYALLHVKPSMHAFNRRVVFFIGYLLVKCWPLDYAVAEYDMIRSVWWMRWSWKETYWFVHPIQTSIVACSTVHYSILLPSMYDKLCSETKHENYEHVHNSSGIHRFSSYCAAYSVYRWTNNLLCPTVNTWAHLHSC